MERKKYNTNGLALIIAMVNGESTASDVKCTAVFAQDGRWYRTNQRESHIGRMGIRLTAEALIGVEFVLTSAHRYATINTLGATGRSYAPCSFCSER